ncbi:5-formyltetrahydrofolate cyclo-ligase [Neobacillus sp. MM2021_6]|uniref:5-formyltetrahydrofolate cyclo-ligase n=1 Tax=Bacillaceae TaxID=186817 RepID=UPI001409D67E|nr:MULTISPECIES: 5-formyltetrahydrofolate cyclo-ligase [Bacillaceae]MBO0959501.1 5-formyltetrahydrofolate cyclo-ligase [Neobacillus sp. MM2021_6]NHC17201.1 5-formyltetrahydrofolate cyclo-ligase [Bacillus sp. MM2020_4]
MNDKNFVRNQIKESLTKISKPLYEDYSYKVADRLFKDEDFEKANVIGITVSKQPEVDTYQIIRKAWELGKQIAVPKCHPKDKRLSFRTLTEFSQLETVYYGLLEPIEAKTTEVPAKQMDLLIVPGLAYTMEGYRLGFGGGYYDRYLPNFTGKTLSLAFEHQIIPNFPVENHDIPVSKIITNSRTIKLI